MNPEENKPLANPSTSASNPSMADTPSDTMNTTTSYAGSMDSSSAVGTPNPMDSSNAMDGAASMSNTMDSASAMGRASTMPTTDTMMGSTPDLTATPDLTSTSTSTSAPTLASTSTAPAASDALNTDGMTGINGLSMADSLASAQDNLTAAGNATADTPNAIGLDEISAAKPEAEMASPMEEPLTPAAPVPGSIGSVTSVPPLANAESMPDTTALDGQSTDTPAAPFNPFATNSDPKMSATPTMNPAFQPAPSAKAATKNHLKMHFDPLTIGLMVAAGIFLITTIVFIFLYINALNNKEIVYYPQTVGPEVSVETLSCTQSVDLGYLANYTDPVMANLTAVVTYEDEAPISLNLNYEATYANDIDAQLASNNLSGLQSGTFANFPGIFTTNYTTNGATMLVDIQSNEGQLTDAALETVLLSSTTGNSDTVSLTNVEATLTQNGAVCTVE